MFSFDFCESTNTGQLGYSRDDRQALNIIENLVSKVGHHYQIALPWKREKTCLPNNRMLALKYLNNLKTKFVKNSELQ